MYEKVSELGVRDLIAFQSRPLNVECPHFALIVYVRRNWKPTVITKIRDAEFLIPNDDSEDRIA